MKSNNEKKLSIVLATYNEEKNITTCLESIKSLADEIVIIDGSSNDKTVEIAKKYSKKVIVTDNPPIFHINKQKALDNATGDWILQLDADEIVTQELALEIRKVISFNQEELVAYQEKLVNRSLFLRHQNIISKRDGLIGRHDNEIVAFYIPRRNFFLGKFLMHGGVYPDGVIRLVKNGKARFPAKSVHEQITVDGKIGWLQHDIIHMDSPTFSKYLARWNRYTDLQAQEIKKNIKRNKLSFIFNYLFYYPSKWFFLTYFRHKGFMDGWQGFVFHFFSSLRFIVSYIKSIK